jgi:hypothetical protein
MNFRRRRFCSSWVVCRLCDRSARLDEAMLDFVCGVDDVDDEDSNVSVTYPTREMSL